MSFRWIEKTSALGYKYLIPEKTMPRIREGFLDIVFFIYPTEEDADNHTGSNLGATGFFVSIGSEQFPNVSYTYAVTNAHVIEGLSANNYPSAVLRFNTKDGKLDKIQVPTDSWFLHPDGDDVAVLPLGLNARWKCKHLPLEKYLLTKDIMNRYGIGTGDETITFGRYSKHSGKNANLPTARFGHISMMPVEPVIQDTRNDYPQESFLVETHSISGYSGSPVMVEMEPDSREAPEVLPKKKAWLLGVDWGHFGFNGTLIGPASQGVKAPSGMMCVVPAWKLDELLNIEDLKMRRKENDKKIEEQQEKSGVSLDSNLTKEEFEDVLKKVSKKIDPSDQDQRERKNK